ncbi:MAG: SPOR domain-containing protein [Blastocatellales bacterium]
MRFIHRSLFSLIVVLLLSGLALAQGVSYTVQFEAAPTKEEAEEKVRQLKTKDVQAYIVKSFIPGKGTFFRVRAGLFSGQAEAKRFGAYLQQRGVISEYFVTTYEKPSEDTVARATPAKTVPAPAAKEQSVKPQAPQANETPRYSQSASGNVPAISGKPATGSPVNLTVYSPSNSAANNSAPKTAVGGVAAMAPAATPAPPGGFSRFQDPKVGYSFDYPTYWTGQPLTAQEANEQRVNAGAMFKSHEDAAFLNAIWNELDKANNPESNNELIVEVILKSMASGEGTRLEETARRVENQNGLIKTYIDLKAAFQTQGQNTPLDFLGKAVIVRASKGILLVVAFYSKDAPPNAASAADKIIASVRAPE